MIAQPLIVIAAALITAREWFLNASTWVLTLNVFQFGSHLTKDLVVFLASGPGMKSGFKSQAIEFFAFVEVSIEGCVICPFHTPQRVPLHRR